MRVCTLNGKLIEAQSHATEGTLIKNAEALGVFGAEESVVTDEEFRSLLIAQRPADTYAELRAVEYPPMAEYMDAIVKGDLVQQQAYIDDCLAVKAKYPKP